jgi:NAD(P)-dependent dehydrogenase (short-subunit alcohol dehydrogenase family)
MDATTPDLTGRICLVTGANRGIGLATSIALARAGAHVGLACRDRDRAERAVAEVRLAADTDRVEYHLVDLASLQSIRDLATQVERRHDRLDVLVNNAATLSEVRQTTVDGRELTFAVNHLAYFLLTRLLLDRLRAAGDGAIVNVAATNHRDAVEDIEDVDSERGYEMRAAYKRSKLANISFTRELARRLGTARPAPRVNAFCPDVVATELLMQFRRVPTEDRPSRLAEVASPDTAARIALSLVTTPHTGRYLEGGVEVTPSPQACDPALAERLWRRCAELTGLADSWSAG